MESEVNLGTLVLDVVPALGVTTLLAIGLWMYVKGHIPSRGERELLVTVIERERKRADKKDNDAHEAHERLDALADTLPSMADDMKRLVRIMESIDRRLDGHGYPEDTQRSRWGRWPW
jgi:hypothetical protein